MRSAHTSTTARLVVLAASLMGMLLMAASPATAANGGTLGITPADESDFFHVELLPGGMTRRTAVVINHSRTNQQIAIYPADGVTTPQGGFSVKTAEQPRAEVGAWTQLPLTTLTLPAGGQRRVTFDLTVPAGTPPGDYSGGIVVQSQPRAGQTTQLSRQTAVQLNFVERVAARIYLRVAGTARPALTLGPLSNNSTGPERTFQIAVTNTGNMRLQPHASLRLAGSPTSQTLTFSAVDTLPPGEQALLQARWKQPPAVFWGKATALVQSEAGAAKATESVRIIPWLTAIIAVSLLLALTWALLRGMRFIRHARRALRSQSSGPAHAPSVAPLLVNARVTQRAGPRHQRR